MIVKFFQFFQYLQNCSCRTLLLLSIHMQSSDTLVTASMMQPADFMARTTGESDRPSSKDFDLLNGF